MQLFTVNNNNINLDMLIDVRWEDGLWVVDFCAGVIYRVGTPSQMTELETLLELDRPSS